MSQARVIRLQEPWSPNLKEHFPPNWKLSHRTVLELHSKTELQRSAEQLKQLRLDLKQRNNQRNIRSLRTSRLLRSQSELKVLAHYSSTAHHLKDTSFFFFCQTTVWSHLMLFYVVKQYNEAFHIKATQVLSQRKMLQLKA